MIRFKDTRGLKVISNVQRINIVRSTGAGGEPTKIVTNINIFEM